MSNEVKIGVSAELDKGDLSRTISDFTQQLNRLGNTIAQANKMKFNPVDKAALDDIKKVTAQFEALKKINPNLGRRLNATGQAGAGFHEIDWNRVYPGGAGAQRVFHYTTSGTAFGGRLTATPATPPGGGGSGSGGGGGGNGGGGYPGQGVVNAGLGAMGPAGGVVARGIGVGASAGLMTGAGAMLGGLAALGVGKLVGSVMSKKDDAEKELVGYDTLKRQLGDVNVSFNILKESTRNTAKALDISFDASQKLTEQFSKLANVSGDRYKHIAGEVMIGGGMSRSLGLDPSVGVGFLGQMRASRATNNEDQSKRMALMIGEAVGKSGSFAKADELLQAVTSFTAQQTRQGMNVANVVGYTGMLSGAVRSGLPGMDMGGAANLIGTVNSAVSSGGRAGEAGQNFLYAALGRKMGLNPVQTQILQEQGAFGTGAGTFGTGSTYSLFAEKYKADMPGAGATGSKSTNLQNIMDKFREQYAGKPDIMLSAMSKFFGTNLSQAAALSVIAPNNITGMGSRLDRLGIKMSDVKASGISALGQLEGSNLSESEKDARAAAIAKKEQESTPGSEARRSREGIENLSQQVAEHLVPLTTSIRDGVLFLAGQGKATPEAMMAKIADMQYAEKAGPLEDRKRRLEKDLGRDGELRTNSSWYVNATPEKQAEIQAKRKAAEEELARINGQLGGLARQRDISAGRISGIEKPTGDGNGIGGGSDGLPSISSSGAGWMQEEFAKTDKMLGLPAGTTAAQMAKESGFRTNAVGPQTKYGKALGMAQILPSNVAEMSRRFGRTMDPMDPKDAILMHREMMRENVSQFGADHALEAYNGGWDKSKWGNNETKGYKKWIQQHASDYASAGASSGAGPGRGSADAYAVLDIRFNHPNGNIETRKARVKIGQAQPAGVQ